MERLREKSGLTRLDVADALGLSERQVYRIEAGTTPAKRSHAFVLASLYGMPVEKVERAALRTQTPGREGRK